MADSNSRFERVGTDNRMSIGRRSSVQQSASGPPVQQTVSVAVLAPQAKTDATRALGGIGLGTGTAGLGGGGVVAWENGGVGSGIDWRAKRKSSTVSTNSLSRQLTNTSIGSGQGGTGGEEEVSPKQSRRRSFFRRATTAGIPITAFNTSPNDPRPHEQRGQSKTNSDRPPFVFKQVPYDVWRRHYAKDASGRYRGTHAPAEDCLLQPEDVERWRFKGEANDPALPPNPAEKWTRGSEALPVYSEAREEGTAPEYEFDDDNQHANVFEGFEVLRSVVGEDSPSHAEQRPVRAATTDDMWDQAPNVNGNSISAPPPPPTPAALPDGPAPALFGGKTAQQVIEEAEARQRDALARSTSTSWKQKLKRGASDMVIR
jgi:hypothetical protein